MENLLDPLRTSDRIYIIDDFCQDEDFFRNLLEGPFHRSEFAQYPGKVHMLSGENLARLSQELRKISPELPERLRSARIRLTDAAVDAQANNLIHFDANSYIMVCYLELPSGVGGQGTSFHSHPKTGERRVDRYIEGSRLGGLNLLMSNNYYDAWKVWSAPKARINRALLFDGHLFHSGPRSLTSRRVTLEVNFRRD